MLNQHGGLNSLLSCQYLLCGIVTRVYNAKTCDRVQNKFMPSKSTDEKADFDSIKNDQEKNGFFEVDS